MTSTAAYDLPEGQLCLGGPVERPPADTLPIRGDLAHIALAGRYLVAHYVVPQLRQVGEAGAALLRHPSDDAVPVAKLDAGATIEVLDYAGDWCWGCCGPQGPTGYVRATLLAQ